MDYHDTVRVLDLPAARLIRATNAPMILSFFYRVFKRENQPLVPEGTLRSLLQAHLDELREADQEATWKSAADYLADWCHVEQPYLSKRYVTGSNEPVFQLTGDIEKVLLWLESLQETRFVGTESRLHGILNGLDEIIKFASADPKERIERLNSEIERLQAELNEIKQTGYVSTYSPVQINERFAQLSATARELMSDFRQVEENFKRIAREIAARHNQADITKGNLVAHLLDSTDAIKTSEQGQSFFAFWELLLAQDKHAKFNEQVDVVLNLDVLAVNNKSDTFLRKLFSHLLREGEQVVKAHQRMSSSLRRVLDTAHLGEQRRLAGLLTEIQGEAHRLALSPPTDDRFFEISDFPDIYDGVDRQPWQPSNPTNLSTSIEVASVSMSRADIMSFRNLPQIQIHELKRRVEQCLLKEHLITLKKILELYPPQYGVMEVIGYLIIAAGDSRHYVGDEANETEVVEIPPDRQQWRIPAVLFGR